MTSPTPTTRQSRLADSSLRTGWLVVDGYAIFHRESRTAGDDAPAMVHVHGFGISRTYLEPTANRLTHVLEIPA